jgi:G8 domain
MIGSIAPWIASPLLLLLMLVLPNVAVGLVRDFVPLSCNKPMATTTATTCQTWTAAFGRATSFANRLLIDCGTCVILKPTSSVSLTLLNGIDIRGKLIVESRTARAPIQIETSMIVVQGELEMTATSKTVDGKPLIYIKMIGTNDNETFTPIGENAKACQNVTATTGSSLSSRTCKVGRKSITVAGGKVKSTWCIMRLQVL